MNALVHTPFAAALGWTLFHSLWEGVIVAAVLAVALCAVRSSRTRYLCAGLAMIAILAAAAVTLIRMMPESTHRFTTPRAFPVPALTLDFTPAVLPNQPGISAVIPWLTPLWIVGVIAFYLRGAASWAAARRLRRTGVCLAPEPWRQRLQQLGERLHLTTAVSLLESSIANTPVVIGFLRPVILTPVGMLAGMPASQIEAILLHELAHVRRRDYLANLLQTVAEGLLFYHPAVWWISHVLRVERENCCDDLVVIANGDAHEYATALSVLAENRLTGPALSASGGHLMKRIRRLLYPETTSPSFAMPLFSAGAFAIVTAWAAMAWQAPAVRPAPKPPFTQPIPIAQAPIPRPLPPQTSPSAAAPDTRRGEDVTYVITDAVRTAFRQGQTDDERKAIVQRIAQAQTPRPLPAQAAPSAVDPYTRWLNEDVAYIITDEERIAFERLQTDDERKAFIEQFWLRRDPTPGTPFNEYKEEHYRRIQYGNNHFQYRSDSPGWKTDRGRIYIAYGPPDEIDQHPNGGNVQRPANGVQFAANYLGVPFETWRYRYIQGIGNDVDIDFVDGAKTGEYPMAADPNGVRVPPTPSAERIMRFQRDISLPETIK